MATYTTVVARREAAPVNFVACAAVGFTALAALVAGLAPLKASIVTIFLFAGPHNWMEGRYLLSRMPVRWAASRNFFLVAISGVLVLTGFYAFLPLAGGIGHWSDATWSNASAVWNSLLVLWITALIYLRGRERRNGDWSLAIPIGLALVSINWMIPGLWEVGLVYLHPLVALWFLDRQLRKSRPEWLRAYHMTLCTLPVMLGILWLVLANSHSLPDDNGLALRITQHAGAGFLRGVSSHLLVSTHVFLETIHYGVWLVALPVLGLGTAPWLTSTIPLVRHRLGWPRAVRTTLILGAFAVVLLWIGFAADYSSARDLYFTAAIAHVLAEAPFLLRML
ncbi:MAG TPA: hypothetical protein VJX67_13110 [Blastocatellia bacterium]|nr:hypothetical protein [Blastocatellia bacterium]